MDHPRQLTVGRIHFLENSFKNICRRVKLNFTRSLWCVSHWGGGIYWDIYGNLLPIFLEIGTYKPTKRLDR